MGLDLAGDLPLWPPDAFAAVASLLQRSDTYRHAVRAWPPKGGTPWANSMREIGLAWRSASVPPDTSALPRVPPEPHEWWHTIQKASSLSLDEVEEHSDVVEALLQLLSAADEACMGVGIPWVRRTDAPVNPPDAFETKALELLARSNGPSSLCSAVHPTRAIVLPKMHTPQSGLSLRSLSHHVALCDPGEVEPHWDLPPRPLGTPALNLLLFPWPLEVLPAQFRENEGQLENMDRNEFRFFTCDPPKRPLDVERVKALVKEAERTVGDVHILVFPELALREGEAPALARALHKIVIAGEGSGSNTQMREPGSNTAVIAVPRASSDPYCTRQSKHHRWRLDGRQIGQYGLGSRLDPNCSWWEHIDLPKREIRFWCLDVWLTFCVLICEDLARQEPVAPAVRAVGPNLVIALVMDGPQLAERWTSRYAMVLADDPGSSVLALTSLGMLKLSRAPGKPPSRSVALWKDGRGGTPREIELDEGAEAIILCLTREDVREWTADGRQDDGSTGYMLLNGVHPVRAPKTPDFEGESTDLAGSA